jgi:hypothetical protein
MPACMHNTMTVLCLSQYHRRDTGSDIVQTTVTVGKQGVAAPVDNCC